MPEFLHHASATDGTARGARAANSRVAADAFLVTMAGTTLPTPL